ALKRVPVSTEGSIGSQAFSSALLVCGRLPTGDVLRVGACLGPELGLERAAARGLERTQNASIATYGALARLDLSVVVAPKWQLDAHGLLSLRLGDKRFTFLRDGERHQAYALSTWGAGAALGVSRTF